MFTGQGEITGDVGLSGNLEVLDDGRIVAGNLCIEDGRIHVGGMILDPSDHGGSMKFPNGAEVFTDGDTIQLVKGNSVVQVSDAYARLQHGGDVVQIDGDGRPARSGPRRPASPFRRSVSAGRAACAGCQRQEQVTAQGDMVRPTNDQPGVLQETHRHHRGRRRLSSNVRLGMLPFVTQMGVTEARGLAGLFTTATLRSLAAPAPWEAIRRLQCFPDIAAVDISLGELFDEIFVGIARTRPSEYVFKNAIVSRLVFGCHRPTTAGAMLEMPIGQSVADVVVVNGTITAYEIKTDLDSFARLDDQLADYSTFAENVYVVTSEGRSEAAFRAAPQHVGVIAVNKRGRLSTLRGAAGGLSRVRPASLFGSLRQAERVEVLRRVSSYAATGSHGAVREAFTSVPVPDLYPEVIRSLRARLMAPSELVAEPEFPHSLRALAYGANLSRSARTRLAARLKSPPRNLPLVP